MPDIVVDGLSFSPLNIVAEQGSNFIRTMEWQDANGTGVDITGYQATLVLYKAYPKTALKAAYTVGPFTDANTTNGYITISGTTISINIPAATMSAIPAGVYDYYMDMISTDFKVTRLLSGLFEVVQETTY